MDEVTLNDLLECSVCLDRLDTSSKVLPCQHTFCKKCLEEIVQKHKELRCPECRILVTIKVDDLPPNVLLMRILEGMKNAVPKLQQRNVRGQQHQQQQTQMHHQMMQAVSHHHQHHGGVGGGTPDRKAGGQNKHGTSSSPHNVLPHQPYAKALYDYDSKEPGDLSFKRGDIIFLRKRIDAHWFQGECGGRQGLFPLSYVQVITPLPSLVPQCKALYDFQTDKHEEEGCLVFKEGDVINVIRRVDENWAEGKLDGRIGIFPLTFVELNNLARSLMKLSTNSQPGPSRVAPPTPTTEESTTPLIPTDHSRLVIVPQQPQQQPQQQNNLLLLTANQGNHSVFGGTLPLPHQQPLLLPQQQTPVHHHQQQQQQQQQAPATAANLIRLVPISDSIGSSSSSSTTTTTTPNVSSTSNTSSSSASNSSTAPSSPASPPTAAAAVALPRNIPKPELPSLSPAQRSPNAGASTASSLGNHHSESGATRPSVHGGLQNKEKRHSLTNISPTPIVGNLQSTSSSSSHHPHHRHSAEILTSGAAAEALPMMGPQNSGHHSSHNTSSKRSVTVSNAGDSSGDPKLPAAYVALYPYKPQKADELGLRKGAVYMVTERCQDGWYKGTSSRTHKCGVFPGNYVTYLGPKPCPAASSRDGDGSSTVSSSSATASGVSFTRAGKSNANPTSKSNNSSSCNASLQRQACTNNNLPPPELPPRSVSPAAAASSSSANASISASWHGNAASASPQPHQESVAVATAPLGRSTSAIMPSTASSSSPTTTHNNGSVATASATTKPADKTKDRKEKGTVGLMRRLTSIKRSKSPPAASTYSMDNPVFEDSSVSVTTATAHPVHVRSGSCPSQLLQIQPPSAAEHHRMLFGGSTSQRLKHKERPSVLTHSISRTADQQNPNSSTAAGGTASSNPTSTNHPNRHHHHHTHNHHQHRKSNSLDAGGIGSGGISSNRGATLAAQSSAAMKTAVMTVNNELFRCEIPYPPNSEYELELQKNDLIYVHKKRDDGWYKGTLQRTGRTGLFPASFVKPA